MAHHHPLEEHPDTEYIAIIVVVVIFVVLFITVNLALDFFGVWFWVAFVAAFINLLLCMWFMCGPGCKDTSAFSQRSQQNRPTLRIPTTSLGGTVPRQRACIQRRVDEIFGDPTSQESGEGGSASSPALIEASAPSQTDCNHHSPSPPQTNDNHNSHSLETQLEDPPSYEEALSMRIQEVTQDVGHS